MKQLMLGNAAVARGLYEAGCGVVSSYPGTPSTEITEECAKYDEIYCEWAPNEKVAMEVAFGASLAGKRSFCGMKHVGLNVAADPLFTMSYTGVNGGMVIGVADDAGMHSSHALKSTGDEEMMKLARKVKTHTVTADEIAQLVAFTKENGGIEYADKRMWDFHAEAMNFLDTYVEDKDIYNALKAYLDFVIERKA